MKNSIEAAGACLDNNHTHFFLVDNGTVNQYGKEIQFRAQLEKQIMKMEVDKSEILTPSCLLFTVKEQSHSWGTSWAIIINS